MSPRRLALLAVACAVAGAALMVLVDSPWARGGGVALMVAFVAMGAWAVATPEYLGRADDWDERDPGSD